MSKTLSLIAMAIALAIPVFAATYYVDGSAASSGDGTTPQTAVKTIAEGVTAAGDGDVIRVAAGTYAITSTISVSAGITIQPDPGKPGTVTVDASNKCRIFDINHADAVVEGLRLYRGKNSALAQYGGGVRFGANGGTLRNCIVESCSLNQNNSTYGGGGVYVPAGAKVTGCIIKNCYNGVNSGTRGIGAYVNGGTLEKTLVVGCRRTAYSDSHAALGAVYLAKGTVDRCTIVGNTVSEGPLYVVDSANAVVRDTIVWGNWAFRDAGSGRPNVLIGANASVSGLCTTAAFGSNPVIANPCFIDAANGDYRLSPASPCIGAGTGGVDLGYADYDSNAAPIGIAVSACRGEDALSVTVSLVPAAGVSLSGANVSWEGLAETGTSFTHTFGPGTHTLRATVTLPGEPPVTVTLADAIQVTCTGDIYVDDDSATPVSPYSSVATAAKTVDAALDIAGDGAVIHVAEGNYVLNPTNYFLVDGIKVIGSGARDATILTKKSKKGRFFYLNNADAAICNLTMRGGSVEGVAGGIWIAGDGGMVSNCTIRGCSTGASQNAGGVLMESAAAILTHSLIMENTAGAGGAGSGISLAKGMVDNCLIISNKVAYNTRTSAVGGGIYMTTSTDEAKVVNCTIAANSAYKGGGIYRGNGAGFVYNTIVYENTSYIDSADIIPGSGATRPPETSFANCCISESIGTDCQVATTPPYELPSYELSAAASGLCINRGGNAFVDAEVDYAGNARIFNGTVDIGAYEYSKTEVSAGFTSDKTYEVGESGTFVFTASVQGADPADCSFVWFLDGSSAAAATGPVATNILSVGRHSVRLVVSHGGSDYEHVEIDLVTVYPTDIYARPFGSSNPEWPYATPATAASNLNDAVTLALRPGGSLHIAPGSYRITNTLHLAENRRIIGAGRDETVIYGNRTFRIMEMNGAGTYVEGLCVSNGAIDGAASSGGLYIYGDGGTFADGRIVDCIGAVNQSGGGAYITGSGAKVLRTIIANNTTRHYSGSYGPTLDHSGAGIIVEQGAVLENSIITGNRAWHAAGVLVYNGGIVRNCVIVGNTAGGSGGTFEGCGGVSCRSSSAQVVNCIIWDNTDLSLADPDDIEHNVHGAAANFLNNCIPIAHGTACVTGDPQFKNAAAGDYRIRGSSPCRDKGLYQDWMADAVDFFDNPRARGRHVDIGYHQSEPTALTIFLQ